MPPRESPKETGSSEEELRRALRNIWSQILERDFGPTEDELPFIDIGGDSLAAMLCISRVRRSFGVEIEIDDFFVENSSIDRFASLIRERM